MGLSNEEVSGLVKKFQKDFEAVWGTKDANKLADFYHPNAVIVHINHQSFYGREAIVKQFEQILQHPKKISMANDDTCFEAGNGEYLITRGHWISESEDGSKKQFWYETILKKCSSNGQYLIYHDEFEYEL